MVVARFFSFKLVERDIVSTIIFSEEKNVAKRCQGTA